MKGVCQSLLQAGLCTKLSVGDWIGMEVSVWCQVLCVPAEAKA
jgi:hypothetical protein